MGKNYRLLEGLGAQFCASPNHYNIGRETLRVDHLSLILRRLSMLEEAEAVKEVVKFISMKDFDTILKMSKFKEVVEFMHTYCISMEDFVTILEMSKFKGLPNPLDDTSAKAASRKAYSRQKVRLTLVKDAPTKWVASMLEPRKELITNMERSKFERRGLLKSALSEAIIARTRTEDLSTLALKKIRNEWVAAMVQVVEDTVAEGIAENEEENPSDAEEDQEDDLVVAMERLETNLDFVHLEGTRKRKRSAVTSDDKEGQGSEAGSKKMKIM